MDKSTIKRQHILDTTCEIVVEEGLKGTTIAQISKRARLSPGIIYYYFDSKDEILHQIYADIEQAFVSAMSNGNPFALPILDCYQQLWLNTYHFGLQHPQQIQFIENYQNSVYFQDRTASLREQFLSELQEKTAQGIASGQIKDLPIEAIYAMLIRPAIELTKLQRSGVDFLYTCSIEEIAASICRSLQKD